MSDVAKKAITANDIHNGWVTAYVNQLGVADTLAPVFDMSPVDTSGLFNKLGDRFDDPTYYTA